MKVLRKSDRVKFSIDGVEFVIAPLSYRDRIESSTLVRHSSGEVKLDWVEQTSQLVRKCLKGISGLKDFHGNDYSLTFEENGEIESDCLNEILASLSGTRAIGAIIHVGNGNMESIVTNAEMGEVLEFTVLGK